MTKLSKYINQLVSESLDELKLRPTKTVDPDDYPTGFDSEEEMEAWLTKKTGTSKNSLTKKMMRKALIKKTKKKKKPVKG